MEKEWSVAWLHEMLIRATPSKASVSEPGVNGR